MLLEPLRNWVKKLESEMLKSNPDASKEIKRCALGDADRFKAAFLNICESPDGDGEVWETEEHGQFYVACQKLKDAEERELKAAFAAAR